MSEPPAPLLEFPCSYPLKAIGKADDDFEELVMAVVRRHVAPRAIEQVLTRPSAAGTYLAVTVTFTASSQEEIDLVYLDLSAHQRVLMVL